MNAPTLEHINLTVKDPLETAEILIQIFGWKIRWQGEAIHGGFTVHVGSDNSYLALYTHEKTTTSPHESYQQLHGLNHIGIVVDDLAAVEQKVIDAGFTPHLHADYEPGSRFYFDDSDGLEFEVVSYRR